MLITPRLLFVVAGLAFAALMVWPTNGVGGAVDQARSLVGSERVILFSATWCGYCDRLRADLKSRHVAFAERDVESSAAVHKAWKLLGGRGVPVTLVGDTIIHGYQPERVRAALADLP